MTSGHSEVGQIFGSNPRFPDVDPQQAHSLNLDLPLAKEMDQPHVLAQSHDQPNGGGQQQGKSSCLQWCWVQVRLHEKK